MFFKILDNSKKKKFIQGISSLGIDDINELLIRSGSERIRAYSGDLSTEEINQIIDVFPVESIGLYVGKEIVNRKTKKSETRLSLEGVNLWKEQIKKQIISIDKETEDRWFKGEDILIKDFENIKEGFVIIKSQESGDLIGVGKLGKEKIIFNYLPKERRRKN